MNRTLIAERVHWICAYWPHLSKMGDAEWRCVGCL